EKLVTVPILYYYDPARKIRVETNALDGVLGVSEFLSQFYFLIKYRLRKKNIIVDVLSRKESPYIDNKLNEFRRIMVEESNPK
ncbi:Retrovirus polyprotein, partial [Penicillium rubens]